MKTIVQCANCGLNNKATQTNCIRCYAALEGLPVSTIADENPRRGGIPLWVKLSAAGGVLFVLFVLVAALGVFFAARKSITGRYAHLENAIRVSPDFSVPVTVEAGRYAYWDLESANKGQDATPAAYTLERLGLIYIHTGMYSDVSPTVTSTGKIVIDPYSGAVPKQYRHVTLELMASGQSQSANWEPYDNKKDGKVGWKVPIGDREFLRVVQVMAMPEGMPSGDDFMVSFTWKWKPNETGQSFDKASPSFVTPATPKNFPRSPFDVEVNDSRATYWGTADLHRAGDTWEVSRVSWSGSGGIKLVPNDSEQIDRMLREAQKPR